MASRNLPRSSIDPEHVDAALDDAIEDTFPASDPIALCMYSPMEIAAVAVSIESSVDEQADEQPPGKHER